MEILTLCGSPRFGKGPGECTSLYLLQRLEALLGPDFQARTEAANPARNLDELAQALPAARRLVLAFPLYDDSIPTGLLETLAGLERRLSGRPGLGEIPVYGLVNCGFFEAAHNELAVEMLEIWRKRLGFRPGRILAVGGGEMVRQAPMGPGPLASLSKKLEVLAQDIRSGAAGPALWAQPNFPRPLYRLAGNLGFRQQARKNGLSAREIKRG